MLPRSYLMPPSQQHFRFGWTGHNNRWVTSRQGHKVSGRREQDYVGSPHWLWLFPSHGPLESPNILSWSAQTIGNIIIWFLSCSVDRIQTPGGRSLSLIHANIPSTQSHARHRRGLSHCLLSDPKNCLSVLSFVTNSPYGNLKQEAWVILLTWATGFTFLETNEQGEVETTF